MLSGLNRLGIYILSWRRRILVLFLLLGGKWLDGLLRRIVRFWGLCRLIMLLWNGRLGQRRWLLWIWIWSLKLFVYYIQEDFAIVSVSSSSADRGILGNFKHMSLLLVTYFTLLYLYDSHEL